MSQLIGRIVLHLMGWKIDGIRLEPDERRVIAIFTHTTNWDGILLFLYGLVFPELRKKLHPVIKPQVFKYVFSRWFFGKLNAIKAPRLEDTGSGGVTEILKRMEHNPEFIIAISPEGKRAYGDWRSGWYALANDLKCNSVRVIGFDFIEHRLKIKSRRNPVIFQTRERLENKLKEDAADIVPLFPKETSVTVKKFEGTPSIFDWSNLYRLLRYLFLFLLIRNRQKIFLWWSRFLALGSYSQKRVL